MPELIPVSELAPVQELQPGLILPDSPQREILEKIEKEAYSEWYGGFGSNKYTADANAIANSVSQIPEIELLVPSDYGVGYHNRCAHFAFGKLLGEDWAVPHTELPAELWSDPVEFLKQKGFVQVIDSAPGDLVAYARIRDRAPDDEALRFEHFAVLETGNKAISKLGQGPVVRHPVELVPTSYGNTAFFFRKQAA
ncbi:MAG: hypothetical protein JWM81_111 [Candidatus Saccharibacteria bacterium]|nr:hypothetical protein [Candidatus Saccharibacteria bacterium]